MGYLGNYSISFEPEYSATWTVKRSSGCKTESQSLGISLLILVEDFLLPVIFMKPVTIVLLKKIYMIKPHGANKSTAIFEVRILGTKGTENP